MVAFVIFYFWLLPFQWALEPYGGVDLALSRVLAAFILLAWGARSLAKRRLVLPSPYVLWFGASYLFLVTVSFFWAENREWAIRKILFLWTFFPLLVVFSDLLRDESTRTKIVKAFVGGATLAALVGILQFLFQFPFGVGKVFEIWTRQLLPFFLGSTFGEAVAAYPSLLVNISGRTVMRASAFFPDPHMMALYLGLSLPFAGALLIRNWPERRLLNATAVLLLLVADALTFSRGGYIGLGVGLVFLFGVWLAQPMSGRMRSALRHPLIIGGILCFSIVLLLQTPVGTRLGSSFSTEDGSNTERLRLWQETVGYISHRPFLGAGIGNYPLLAKPSATYREPIYAHNLYLDIASEVGLLGLSFFVGLLGLSFFTAWSGWRKNRDLFALASATALLIFSVHALFETPLFSVQVLPALLLVVGLVGV